MRPVEFRAWDGKEMHDDVCVIGGKAIHHSFHATSWIPEAKAGVLMERIDLEATGGVKIFEDDVVKFIDDDGSVIIGKVKLFRLQWGLMNDEGFYPFSHQIQTSRNDYHEVLGNIHKNPDWMDTLCNPESSDGGSDGQ